MTALVAATLASPVTQSAGVYKFAQGFAEGAVPAGKFAVCDLPRSAVVPSRTWPDGSLRHAHVIIGSVALAGSTTEYPHGVPRQINFVRRDAAPATGTLLTAADIAARAPTASISFGAFGTVTLASLLASPALTFISTAEMAECHYIGRCPGDLSLRGEFRVRLYLNGNACHVRAIGRNGALDASERLTKSYVPTITIGGVVKFNNSGQIYNQAPFASLEQEAWIGATDPQIEVRHDSEYLVQAKLLSNYWKRGTSQAVIDDYKANAIYTPGAILGFTPQMGATGAQDQIGILPRWDALWVASQAAPGMLKVVTEHARAINSYPIAWADNTTLQPIRVSDFPSWSTAGASGGGQGAWGAYRFGDISQPLQWEGGHFPDAGYLAYLLTGDKYFLDAMAYTCALTYLMGTSEAGLGVNRAPTGQNRARAWTIRSLTHAASIYPDSMSSQYGHLSAWLEGIAAKLVGYLSTVFASPFETGMEDVYYNRLFDSNTNSVPVDAAGHFRCRIAPFEFNFAAMSWGRAGEMKPCANMVNILTFRNYVLAFPVNLMGGSSNTEYPASYASSYTIDFRIGESATHTQTVLPSQFIATNMGMVYSDSVSTDGSVVPNPGITTLEGTGGSSVGGYDGYWNNLTPGLGYADDAGKAGAVTAWGRITSAPNFNVYASANFADFPHWAIVPRSYSQQPLLFTAVDSGASMPTPGPSILCDVAPVASAGIYIGKRRGVGIPNGEIATGGSDGTSPLRDRIESGDSALIEQVVVVTQGANGNLLFDDNGGAIYTGTAGTFSLAFYDIADIASGATSAGSATMSVGASTQTVSADLAIAYAIRNLVGATFTGDYAIAGGVGAVSADFAGAYSIAALVGANFNGSYAMSQFVHADLAGAYAVLVNVVYARAPDGPGYIPQRTCGPVRPANTQGTTR